MKQSTRESLSAIVYSCARRRDATAEMLDGSKHNDTLTFPAGRMPPVQAFRSVTRYDGKSQLLIENPIHRYRIHSPMLPPGEVTSKPPGLVKVN